MKDKARVVIIGGGVNGLSLAYNLAKNGISDVAVFEKSYLGSGGSGRNAGGIRAQYANRANILLARESLRRAERISEELNFNIMFRQGGYLYLAEKEEQMDGLRKAVALQNSLDVRTRMVYPDEIKEIVPDLNTEGVLGGSYNKKDGISRHDAVVWGYARAAKRLGVNIHPFTKVLQIRADKEEVRSVVTERGEVSADFIVNVAGAHSKELAMQVGVDLPITPGRREIFVTESLKPFLDPLVEDLESTAYFTQTDRGELVSAIHMAGWEEPTFSTQSTIRGLEETAKATLRFFPHMKNINVLRLWAGTYDTTPDGSPILGEVEEVGGFIQANGFSGAGFKLCFVLGELLAHLIMTGKTPSLIEPYQLRRFKEGKLLVEIEAGETNA